ncbi:MAG: hypothetical protein ACRDS0_24595 [Pseudonocardiaceae bacterium]
MTGLDHLSYEDVQFLAEVHRLVTKAEALAGGCVPAAGTDEWFAASPMKRLAALLVLAERYLIEDPHAIAAEMIKDASVAVSSDGRWSAARALPSHHELVRRRAEPGPLAGLSAFDPVAARRWVETGDSAASAA